MAAGLMAFLRRRRPRGRCAIDLTRCVTARHRAARRGLAACVAALCCCVGAVEREDAALPFGTSYYMPATFTAVQFADRSPAQTIGAAINAAKPPSQQQPGGPPDRLLAKESRARRSARPRQNAAPIRGVNDRAEDL